MWYFLITYDTYSPLKQWNEINEKFLKSLIVIYCCIYFRVANEIKFDVHQTKRTVSNYYRTNTNMQVTAKIAQEKNVTNYDFWS